MSSPASSAAAAAAAAKKNTIKVKKEEDGSGAEGKPRGEAAPAMMCSVFEIDPAREDPKLLDAIREKNKDAMAYLLDPSRAHSKSSKPNATEAVWYFSTGSSHHVTGDLDLLTDLTPVTDRWVRAMTGAPLQVLVRGSVNSKGVILHDVWYIPDCCVNVLSGVQLGLKMHLEVGGRCTFYHGGSDDDTVIGKAHKGASGLLEVDFFNANSGAVWYIVSNVSQHMTGNLELLTNFSTIRPSHPVQTHTGAKLQVTGKGSVKTKQFSIPSVSYVPSLTENIISLSQLTDSGFTVKFGADGFTVTKRHDGTKVGSGSYGGNQVFRLDNLRIPLIQ